MFHGPSRPAFLAALLGVLVCLQAPPVRANEHLRSKVHPALWYYWPQRYLDYYAQDTRGGALNVGPGAGLTNKDIAESSARAFSAWSLQTQGCTDLQFFFRGYVTDRDSNMTVPSNSGTNGKNTIIFRYNDWDGTECLDAIACTTVVTRRAAGEIIDADIDLNLAEHTFVLDPIPGSPAFDLQSVLTHEIGHLLGFDHTQPEHPDAVMWPYASWGEEGTRRDLTQDDVNVLCDTYPNGECTVVNDYGQSICPSVELQGGCSVARDDATPRGTSPGWVVAILAGLVGVALVRRRDGKRSSSRAS